jgi:hypothetical protein
VLEAAGCNEAAACAAWVCNQLQQPLLGGRHELLSKVNAEGPQALPHRTYLRFKARLHRNFRGKRKGEEVLVEGDVGPPWGRELQMHEEQGSRHSSVGGLVLGVDSDGCIAHFALPKTNF